MPDRRQQRATTSRAARATPSADSALAHGLTLTALELQRENGRLRRALTTVAEHCSPRSDLGRVARHALKPTLHPASPPTQRGPSCTAAPPH